MTNVCKEAGVNELIITYESANVKSINLDSMRKMDMKLVDYGNIDKLIDTDKILHVINLEFDLNPWFKFKLF